MFKKIIEHPIGMVTAAIALVTGITSSGNTVLDNLKIPSTTTTPSQVAKASSLEKSCFEKIQDLEKGAKQGITVCFQQSLENVSFEYFSLTPDGIRSSGLKDKEKFKAFVNIQDFKKEINEAEKGLKQQVKGVNSTSEPVDNAYQVKSSILRTIDLGF